MPLAVTVLMTQTIIILFGLIPKKLSDIEMVVLFFVDSIFSISIFTTVELNLKWVTVSESVDRVFAVLVGHVIETPLVMVLISNVILYRSHSRWLVVMAAWVAPILEQLLMREIGVISFENWNPLYGAIEFAIFLGFSAVSTWFVRSVSKRDVKALESLR